MDAPAVTQAERNEQWYAALRDGDWKGALRIARAAFPPDATKEQCQDWEARREVALLLVDAQEAEAFWPRR